MSRRAGAPTGASRICLSCHDGTIAVGRLRSKTIRMVGGDRPLSLGGAATLGTDLRGTHPISIKAGGGGTTAPPHGDAVKVDVNGEVQCTSCHDPHAEFGDPELGMFLVKPSANSSLCESCHRTVEGTRQSSHFGSSAPIASASSLSRDGRKATASSVGAGGCSNCHASHHAPPGATLDRPGPTDDGTCLGCHDGSVARLSVAAEVAKPTSHRSTGRGVHSEGERSGAPSSGKRLPETSFGRLRHVACVDCHDPHRAVPSQAPSVAPAAQSVLTGQWGISIDGQRVEAVSFEYEVCLKCHGDSLNKPAAAGNAPRRRTDDLNLRRVFASTSPSFHPVASPGRNPLVPSLIPPLNPASQIYCTDCHASDAGAGAGGAGPRGPHGSIYPNLLERQYLTADYTPESPASYALCYKCHDRERLLSDGSPFPHAKHVKDASAPCSACHAAHGVSSDAGDATHNAHLISFDLNIVKRAGAADPEYVATGGRSCSLDCHGHVHDRANSAY
jgi:predicted CXXCH cytochrome family protein